MDRSTEGYQAEEYEASAIFSWKRSGRDGRKGVKTDATALHQQGGMTDYVFWDTTSSSMVQNSK